MGVEPRLIGFHVVGNFFGGDCGSFGVEHGVFAEAFAAGVDGGEVGVGFVVGGYGVHPQLDP